MIYATYHLLWEPETTIDIVVYQYISVKSSAEPIQSTCAKCMGRAKLSRRTNSMRHSKAAHRPCAPAKRRTVRQKSDETMIWIHMNPIYNLHMTQFEGEQKASSNNFMW